MLFSSFYIIAMLGLVQAKQHLRRQPHVRQLETTKVPFGVLLLTQVSDEASGIQPTTDDYDAVALACQRWFHENSVSFFTDNNDYDVTYVGTQCEFDEERTDYSPASEDQHTVAMSCESTFDADDDAEMISVVTLVTEATKNYVKDNLLAELMFTLAPTGSPFKAIRNVNINLGTSHFKPRPTNTPMPTSASNPTDAPGGVSSMEEVPTNTPMPTNNTSEPTNATGGVSDTEELPTNSTLPTNASEATNRTGMVPSSGMKEMVEVVLQYTMSVQTNIVDRQPTPMEYTEFMDQSDAYLRNVFSNAFHENNPGLAHFTGVVNSSIKDQSYVATAAYPHTITIHYEMEFERSSGEVLPGTLMWAGTIRDATPTFQRDYLGSTGIFSNLHTFSYRVLN